ncbi:proprotein convertase subtilisin/kexin type 5-like [Oxyura jamaicensis]|uniref:proprotein convertase subtilisin/kexin type 5-like n=1 Tax=Oxyura jamaicensis TaxID=8884 RepID=UPI0015A6CDA7|nr:proprotein convertase subtilisin/kexin type 5-like [Oxyura jamaicensis]
MMLDSVSVAGDICVTECGKGFFNDDMFRECEPCHRSCKTCVGYSYKNCTECRKDFLLSNGQCLNPRNYQPIGKFWDDTTCVETCPDGYYADSDEGWCSPCHSACATCSGKHSSQCLSCKPGWYRQGKGCVNQCPSGYFAQNSTGSCERCHKGCKECMGPQQTDCLFCDTFFYLLRSKNQCVSSCPEYYYENKDNNICERCHPFCRTCTGKEAFSCTSCVWSYSLLGGMCNSDCFVGSYKVEDASGQEEDEPKCESCDSTCTECKGPGPLNCTICPAGVQLYLEQGRCLPCCRDPDPEAIPECCDCSETQDDCVLRTTQPPASKSKTSFFVITSILLLLVIGAIVVIWRKSKSKRQAAMKGGYEKLTNHSKVLPSYMSNYHETTSYQEDQVIEYRDRDVEDDDEDDIVYMGQDGTVYRKFKYGLLEDDEEDELEYDDESYSFR